MKIYRFFAAALALIALTGCGLSIRAASEPTLQSTETALPLVTATAVPTSPPMTLPAVDWSDVSVYRKAMRPGFEDDVNGFVNANRYLIVAALSVDNDAIIRGAERVRFINHTPDALDKIVFRLYPNTPVLGGRMDVTFVSLEDKAVEPAFSDLDSVMSVPLPKPLPPDQSVELKLDFDVVMPRGLNTSYGRFGYANNVVSSTAWYPTLSVYDVGRGWWTTMPSPQGDPAYTETGLYDVRLTIPANMTVVMSGAIVETTKNGDNTTTYRGVTGPMRDHAFQASERYMITPAEADGVRINVVHYKDRATQPTDGTDNVVKYAVIAVQTYNKTFGAYPYTELNVVENPTPSGVEFPGLIQIADRAWIQGNDFLETVVCHEIGHQWFYSLVGNNQVEHPWLDESLTSYLEFVYMRAAYPTGSTADNYVANFQRRYTAYTGAGQPDMLLDLPVSAYSGYSYGAVVYTKGPLFYLELERQLGSDTVYKALAVYFKEHKYGVVTSADVKKAFEEVSGRDLTDLFKKWVGGFGS